MHRLLTAFVVAVLGCSAFTSGAAAQEKTRAPRLTHPELKQMVDGMGFETKAVNDKYFQFRHVVDNRTTFIGMHLSPDGSNIWFEADLVAIEDAQKTPAKTWFDLLSENNTIGPSHFAYCPTAKSLYLYRPVANQDMTSARLREQIDIYLRTIRETSKLWNGANF